MNILLTGGAGYIGSHTAVALIEAGHHAIIYDNFSNSSPAIVRCVEEITKTTVPYIVGDILDTVLLTEVLKKYSVDAVIHFAGLKSVGESVRDPISYYANNVQGTVSLLRAMQSTGSRKLIFSSSATIYGVPRYLPIDEEHPTGATNPYGRTKLHIEEMLADVAQSDATWQVVCLRYFNPVGAHESALIGENPQGTPNNLMPFVTRVGCGMLRCLTVYGADYDTPDGTGVRDYVHVLDLAEGHVAALSFLVDSLGWRAINLGTGQGRSVLEIVHAFERVAGVQIPYVLSERRPGDVASAYAKVDRASQLLDWQARRSLHEMCESAWIYQLRQGEQRQL